MRGLVAVAAVAQLFASVAMVEGFVSSPPGTGMAAVFPRGQQRRGAEVTRVRAEELSVTLHPDGRISLQVKGVKGEECRELTDELMKELGEIIFTQNTEEFYEQPVKETNREGISEGVSGEWSSYKPNKPSW